MGRENVNPFSLVGHDTTHDLVEGFTFDRVRLETVEHVPRSTFRVLEDVIVGFQRILGAVVSQIQGVFVKAGGLAHRN